MNAHNEQHDPASPVVKQNLTTQPAAAQEAVAWQRKYLGATRGGRPVDWHNITREEFEQTKSGKWADKYDVRELFAAPVTAAPADTWFADQLAAMGEVIPLASTTAAPGIDLAALRARVVSAIERITSGTGQMRVPADMTDPDLVLADVLTLLDALDPHCTDSPKGGSDPWRGLYAPERAPNRDEYGCFYHPDIPSWDDEREESIAPLLKAQGFDLQCVPGDFSDEAMEEGGERYWQEMREWNPEPEGDGWRLVAIYDTEDGPYSMFVKPLAQAGDAEVQP